MLDPAFGTRMHTLDLFSSLLRAYFLAMPFGISVGLW
jgi:hypothetical protein